MTTTPPSKSVQPIWSKVAVLLGELRIGRLVRCTLIFVLALYVVANIVIIRRIRRIAGAIDSEDARVS
jgi:hypothetical protein